MKNIIIFGGAFDPVHSGHLNMALNASKTLDAEVYFVPARISVWKNETINIEDKINMLKLAINSVDSNNKFKISRIEADSDKEINYTIDTVKIFKEKYPDYQLYLLIGTDHVNTFHLWKNAYELSKLAKIIYFERKDLELDKENIVKFSMTKIEGCANSVNSTDIRNLSDLNTPFKVVEYILDKELYFTKKLKSYLTPERYLHSVSVGKLAYEIAESNNIENKNDYLLAGLLHDIGKYISFEKTLKIMNEQYPNYLPFETPIYHQFTGAYLAEHDFRVKNKDVLTAIEFHTTGRNDMTDIEKAVYCADKIDPTRGFDSSELINKIKVNLHNGFVAILKDNKQYFEKKHIDYSNPLTMACMNQYLKK